MIIEKNKILIIPDIHQNVKWLELILHIETDWDHVIFLGDYFDTRHIKKLGVREMVLWIFNNIENPKYTFLLGNHDVQYMGDCLSPKGYGVSEYMCGGFSNSRSKKINKHITSHLWKQMRLFIIANGWMLSHAGLHPSFWYPIISDSECVDKLSVSCNLAVDFMRYGKSHSLLRPGISRGGDAMRGGLTWLDWYDEFEDSIPYPQIVGHTGDENRISKKGRSYNIDGLQNTYAILNGSEIEFKTTNKNKFSIEIL